MDLSKEFGGLSYKQSRSRSVCEGRASGPELFAAAHYAWESEPRNGSLKILLNT